LRPDDREYVQGLERGVTVVDAFRHRRVMSIAQVSAATGLTRAAARRYLFTLQALGSVTESGNGFALTPRILDLATIYLSTSDVAAAAQPVLERVAETLHESSSVAVLDGTDVVYLARVPGKRIMSVNLVVGSRLPAHATSLGKVLLAGLAPPALDDYFASGPLASLTPNTVTSEATLRRTLADVRRLGWASSEEETEAGVRTIAAPLVGAGDQVQAAINVAAHAARVSLDEMRRTHLPVLLEAARQISRMLGGAVVPRAAQPARSRRRGLPNRTP
jgi:IclR family pca regulon transcriptional regulator